MLTSKGLDETRRLSTLAGLNTQREKINEMLAL